MYPPADLGNGNPLFMPFVRTYKSKQQVEWEKKRLDVRLAVHIRQGGVYIGRTFVVQYETGAYLNGKHIQNTALLRLLHTVRVE